MLTTAHFFAAQIGLPVPAAIVDEALTITLETKQEFVTIKNHLRRVAKFCSRHNIQEIQISVKGEITPYVFNPNLVLSIMTVETIKQLSDFDLFQRFGQASEQGKTLALVRIPDNKGLISTNIERHCGARENNWIGQDMSRFWDPSELSRFLDALSTHGTLSGFEYWAYRMDEELTPINIVVNAELILYRGDQCRLVETLATTFR